MHQAAYLEQHEEEDLAERLGEPATVPRGREEEVAHQREAERLRGVHDGRLELEHLLAVLRGGRGAVSGAR